MSCDCGVMHADMSLLAYDCSDLFGDPNCADFICSILEWLDFDMHQDRLQLRHLRRAFRRIRPPLIQVNDANDDDTHRLPPPPRLQRQVATDFREGAVDPAQGCGTREDPIDLT